MNELRDIDGKPLREKIYTILEKLNRKVINDESEKPHKYSLLTGLFIFYKIGLATSVYQHKIMAGKFPYGYEILSSYMLDRFLTKYFREIDVAKKILYLKAIELYPHKKFSISEKGVNRLPRETSFLEEGIRLVEELTSRFLNIESLCRLIMQRKWDKDIFIIWYTRTLSSKSGSIYAENRGKIMYDLEELLNIIIKYETSS